ncbi:radical SAM protein [Magnetovibrio sp.]|uniref:radical SAM protein n=1 Tax=Magnetovibrio sp. TaxID=2024836 RepID=UPI002F93146E
MAKSKNSLLDALNARPIAIWGARMTGMGFLRFSKSHDLNVVSFVDSDPAFDGKTINGIPVRHPDALKDLQRGHPGLAIVIAVSIKEDEIIKALQGMNFSGEDFVLYSDYCDSFYTIDIVGTCNLVCPSCAHSIDGEKYPRGMMSFDNFKLVLDKIKSEVEVVTHVSLYSWGEPFLHPDLPKIIKHLHKNGIAAAVSSNLSIKSADQIRDVIQARPEYLKVSISGYYPDVYDLTHTGGDINLVKSNLYRVKHYIDKYNAGTFVDVNYHLYTNNNHKNLNKMKELCDELGFTLSATYALVMPLERCLDHCDGIEDPQTKALEDILLVNIDEGLEVTKDFRANTCPFKDNQMNINWDLKVPVCCVVFNREGTIVADNFLDSSLVEINKSKDEAEICAKCMGYGLPAYNMGFNQGGWKAVASTKTSSDQ